MTEKPRLGFLGAGRVGKGLSLALSRCGYEVKLGHRADQNIIDATDIVFLTVPDDFLSSVVEKLKFSKNKSAIHCSGAAELSVLQGARDQGARVGGFHPLQMFADPEVAARGLRGCSIAVEADDALAEVLLRMVADLGARALRVPPGGRAAYHAAAHYAGPFVAALLDEAVAVWGKLGIPPQDALAALLPLARGSTDAIAHSGLAKAMAGSVARGDTATIERHLEALGRLGGEHRDFYRRLALRTIPLALAAGSLDEGRARNLALILKA